MSLVDVVLAAVTALAAWLGFIEKRLQDVRTQLDERMESMNEVHKVIQDGLRHDIAKLEATISKLTDKIDQLLRDR